MTPQQPISDEKIDALREEMYDQRKDIREYLAGEGVDVSTWAEPGVETNSDTDVDDPD